jgi:hypothetical protein
MVRLRFAPGFFRGTTMMPKAKVLHGLHLDHKGAGDGGAAYAPRR